MSDLSHFWWQSGKSGPDPSQIGNSLRFRGGQQRLTRTPTTNGNTKLWTCSAWIKKAAESPGGTFIGGTTSGGANYNYEYYRIEPSIEAYQWGPSTSVFYKTSTSKYRDMSAWAHYVFIYDSANPVDVDRVRVYVNGQQVPFPNSNPPQNHDSFFNTTSSPFCIGAYPASGGWTDSMKCYMAEVHFVDGQALAPTTFGEFNADGVWVPKKVSGVTYGTNGFYLDFSDAANIGKDRSGNNNDFTATGFELTTTTSTNYDWISDSPTDNHSTLNPLDNSLSGLYDANLQTGGPGSGWGQRRSTIAMSTGKWYWEDTTTWSGGNYVRTGVVKPNAAFNLNVGQDPNGWGYETSAGGGIYNNDTDVAGGHGSGAGSGYGAGAGATSGQTLGFAFDADTGKLWVRNATGWFASGNPETGANPGVTIGAGTFFAAGSGYQNDSRDAFNFGNRPFAHTPPAGFSPLSTAGLPAVPITKPSDHFTTILDTGANILTAAQAKFPNGLWGIKDRQDNGHVWTFFDHLNGTTKWNTGNQGTGTYTPTAANSYLNYSWDDNPSCGFDIVNYTGDGSSNRLINHDLGRQPAMIWIRPRVDGPNTYVWHKAYGATEYNYLNDHGDTGTNKNVFGSGGHTTTQFMVHNTGQAINNDNSNVNGVAYTAYIWAEVPGFSCFTSFVGNGGNDGPFIYTGFRPAMICSKRMKGCALNNGWHLFNSSQPNYNPVGEISVFDKPMNPGIAPYVDLLSNGFKLRTTDGNHNASGAAFLVFAFAEHPFGGSNVSPATAR